MSVKFTHDSDLGKTLAEWWLGLKDNSAERAELRHCHNVDKIEMTSAFQSFRNDKLRKLFVSEENWEERMAAVVGLMSHLKHNAEDRVLGESDQPVDAFAKQMAFPVSAERPLVSELRFRRILQHERDDLYPAMIRIIRMMKGGANLYGLAHSVYYWGDSIKKSWAYAYFPEVPSKKSA